jgi:SdiA-regulated
MTGRNDRLHGYETMRMYRLLAILALVGATACGDVSTSAADTTPLQRLQLPKTLREVSGLAAVNQHEVLTVTDEIATVYRINLDDGGAEELFFLGDPVIAADFEGITIAGNDVWLVTSRGVLYRAVDGLKGSPDTAFEVFSTGLEDTCEVEGLAFDSSRFLLACKENFRSKDRDKLMIYAWSKGEGDAEVYLAKPLKELGSVRKFSPSGISVAGDTINIVAARQSVLLTINRDGSLLRMMTLKGHPQAEGITVLPDGSLVIADEGKNGGRLSRYAGAIDND